MAGAGGGDLYREWYVSAGESELGGKSCPAQTRVRIPGETAYALDALVEGALQARPAHDGG